MKKQGLLEKVVYYIVGVVFFIAYYLLMVEIFQINPFNGAAMVLTIYFLIAILTFPKAGDLLSNKTKDYIIGSKIIMPLAYILGPIMIVMSRFKNMWSYNRLKY